MKKRLLRPLALFQLVVRIVVQGSDLVSSRGSLALAPLLRTVDLVVRVFLVPPMVGPVGSLTMLRKPSPNCSVVLRLPLRQRLGGSTPRMLVLLVPRCGGDSLVGVAVWEFPMRSCRLAVP